MKNFEPRASQPEKTLFWASLVKVLSVKEMAKRGVNNDVGRLPFSAFLEPEKGGFGVQRRWFWHAKEYCLHSKQPLIAMQNTIVCPSNNHCLRYDQPKTARKGGFGLVWFRYFAL